MIRAYDDPLRVALRPWARRLALEAICVWLARGAAVGLLAACAVLGAGWLSPIAEAELRPVAARLALAGLLGGFVLGAWPVSWLRRAAQVDTRLKFADRLSTAWIERRAQQPMAARQRQETLARLAERSPTRDLPLRWRRIELGGLLVAALGAAVLALAPSPMQPVLDRQAAEQAAVEQAGQRLDALTQDVAADPSLSPEQARRLEELLRQARANLAQSKSSQDAQAVLANAAQQVGQLGDPSADSQDQALSAMSETLSQEPLTRALGDALARNDAQATSQAVQDLSAAADQLPDVQRHALSRALQRAANVGRGDPRSAAAVRDAAQAVSSGQSPEAALDQTSEALQAALQAVTAEASLRSTGQRLQDLRAAMGAGEPLPAPDTLTDGQPGAPKDAVSVEPGRSLPVDASPTRQFERGQPPVLGAGQGSAPTGSQPTSDSSSPVASENVFVPGAPSDGAADQDLVQQPFTVRGQPRPYRQVLGEYAQAGRDSVDRPDVAPAVRDLVKAYFSKLEEDQ